MTPKRFWTPLQPHDLPDLIAKWRDIAGRCAPVQADRLLRLADQLEQLETSWGTADDVTGRIEKPATKGRLGKRG